MRGNDGVSQWNFISQDFQAHEQLGFVDFGYPKTKIGFPDKAANFVVDFGLACFRKHGIFLHDWQICSRDVG